MQESSLPTCGGSKQPPYTGMTDTTLPIVAPSILQYIMELCEKLHGL